MNKDDFSKVWMFTIAFVTVIALASWEFFNWVSTHDSLISMMGKTPAIELISVAIVAVDVMFLAQVFLQSFVFKNAGENSWQAFWNDPISRGISSAWALTTMFDVLLTWYYLASLMEFEVKVIQAPAAIRPYISLFPFAIAILSWLLQGGLVITAGRTMLQIGAIGGISLSRSKRAPRKASISSPFAQSTSNHAQEPLRPPLRRP